MLLTTRARFFGPVDSIQVAILVQEDNHASAASKVRTGTVEILDHGTAMFSETFTGRNKVLTFDGDTNYDMSEDQGYFYFFLHHPPAKQNLSARVSVTLSDSQTATQVVPIDVQDDSNSGDWENPALPLREPVVFDREPDFPYREQE